MAPLELYDLSCQMSKSGIQASAAMHDVKGYSVEQLSKERAVTELLLLVAISNDVLYTLRTMCC